MCPALDPDAIPLPDDNSLWESFDAIERMAGAAKTLLARRVEDSGEWERRGYRSAAEHLAGVGGTSVHVARQMLETSKNVEALPATGAALREGELSPAQAGVIVGAATVNPDWEQRLLTSAQCRSLGDLRNDCLRAKAATGGEETHARIRRERSAREFTDAEGAWNLTLRGPAEEGARIRAAFDPIVDELVKAAYRNGNVEHRGALAFDAFVEMAERAQGESVARRARRRSKSSHPAVPRPAPRRLRGAPARIRRR